MTQVKPIQICARRNTKYLETQNSPNKTLLHSTIPRHSTKKKTVSPSDRSPPEKNKISTKEIKNAPRIPKTKNIDPILESPRKLLPNSKHTFRS